jgi:predicted tellurium resistance membrane protein TerC
LDFLINPQLWFALLTLSTLEIVLGVDNLVFISIAVGRLPAEQRSKARKLGIAFACVTRIMLLLALATLVRMDDHRVTLFSLFGKAISVRDVILGGGGIFLIVKGISEIVASIRGTEQEAREKPSPKNYVWVIAQIAIIDIVFSIDSVITAVGMVRNIPVMIAAIILAVVVMLFASDPVGNFIDKNQRVRMLALAFIVLIGFVLIAEAVDVVIPHSYIYAAMVFSAIVEFLNVLAGRRSAHDDAE